MGIKLQDLIIRNKVEVSKLAGKIIAIDAPNIIMGLFNFARKSSDGYYAGLILDRTQRPISHLYGLLYRVNFYYSKKIFPIFCFDGQDSPLKKLKTKDALNDFLFTQRWYQEAIKNGNRELARKIASSSEYMWHNIIQESKKLLGALGIPYIESPASAESQCAQLVKDKIAYYSNSQDFDSLLFGCPRLVQNLSKSLRRKVQGRWTYEKITPVSIYLQNNLKRLGITQFQLVDMALLIGTDYFPGVKGIGPKKALKLMQKYHELERFLDQEKKNYEVESLTPGLIKKVRKIFLLPEVLSDYTQQTLSWNTLNASQVFCLLCEEHYLNKERVLNNLTKFKMNYEKCRNFFVKRKNTSVLVQKTLDHLLRQSS